MACPYVCRKKPAVNPWADGVAVAASAMTGEISLGQERFVHAEVRNLCAPPLNQNIPVVLEREVENAHRRGRLYRRATFLVRAHPEGGMAWHAPTPHRLRGEPQRQNVNFTKIVRKRHSFLLADM
jgi:hypothetical protein